MQGNYNQRYQEGGYLWQGEKLVTEGRHEELELSLYAASKNFFTILNNPS